MYNDYYLQEISNKLTVVNTNFISSLEKQDSIILHLITIENILCVCFFFVSMWLICFIFFYFYHNIFRHN